MTKLITRLLCAASLVACMYAPCTFAEDFSFSARTSKQHFKHAKRTHRASKPRRAVKPKRHALAIDPQNQA